GRTGDERDRARRYRHPTTFLRRHRFAALPGARRARFASGMRDLDAGHCATPLDDPRQPRHQRLLLRVPQAEAMRSDATDGGHMRRFGEDDAGAPHGTRAEMLDMPIIAEPVDGAVLAHRRHNDAVARGDRSESYRLKQKRRGHRRCDPWGWVADSI